jgi:REP element-mobilizing transposase RayT
MRRSKKRRVPSQMGLAARGQRGGWRPGAGRKRIPAHKRKTVAHRRRPSVSPKTPLHVTLRLIEGFPGLRRPKALRWIRRCLQLAHKSGFAVVQFSIQGNHLHLIIEANDRGALSRGMQGLKIRLAKRLNQLFGGRRGAVFPERYHAQPLRSPRQVRSALLYVLNNRRRHLASSGKGLRRDYVDPYSSAAHFAGWKGATWTSQRLAGESVTAEPRSWLLRVGWRRQGPLDPNEIPGGIGVRAAA